MSCDNGSYSFLMSIYEKTKASELSRSIDCMLGQTVPPSEIVIVKDGGLPPALDKLLADYALKHPNVMKIVGYPSNQGLWYALRMGLGECSNELVARMDSDDYSCPDRIEQELAVMRNDPSIDCVGTNVIEFEGSLDNQVSLVDLPSNHEDILRFGKRRCPFRHPTLLYKKSVVLQSGGYQEMPLFEDYDLYMRMVSAGAKFQNIAEPLVFVGVDRSFFQRRGDPSYLKKMVYFRTTCLKRRDINAFEYTTSIIPHAIVCLLPNRLREFAYKTFLRAEVK